MNFSPFLTLIISLITITPLFSVDADIFKEMLTLSAPIETQEQKSSSSKPEYDCQQLIEWQCRSQRRAFEQAQIAAFITADAHSLQKEFRQLNRCRNIIPCVQQSL